MNKLYTDEKNVLILLSLLKKHKIKRVIASPGTTNATFVRSIQVDPYFEVYSCVDERSAAYMACGLAAESGEPVIISCTGATASRNYLPGMTEAFYRKLPIMAITSTRDKSKYGHHEDQVIDRRVIPNDVAKFKTHIPNIKDKDDEWECSIKVNNAIIELTSNGGGPVHVNLSTTYNRSYSTKELPAVNAINKIESHQDKPDLPSGSIGIFIGSHKLMTAEETYVIDAFCESNNAVVFCDHTSGYHGKYGIRHLIPLMQLEVSFNHLIPETLIHIGEITGFYHQFKGIPNQVWRVSEDGKIRDTFQKIRYIFEMNEIEFFQNYIFESTSETSFYETWNNITEKISKKMPEVPFSNLWVAQKISHLIPKNSNIHFGILNSLSSWNFFNLHSSINTNSNVGGYGIDGCVSSLLGASLNNKEKLFFGVVGDLAFFYDMNSIGNRHVSNNIRLMIINNGKGVEFKIKNNPATQFGSEIDEFIAAAGHFGNKSKTLIKDYAISLGFEYLSASSKDEFEKNYNSFVSPEPRKKPIIFEVFTSDHEEDEAQKMFKSIEKTASGSAKRLARGLIGESSVNRLNKLLKK